MNYKRALVPKQNSTQKEEVKENTKLQNVIRYGIWEGRTGWIKIYSSTEPITLSKKKDNETEIKETTIDLESFVKLQERRIAEYDSERWEGAFREMFPIYPPYPDDDDEFESDENNDGTYISDNEGLYYSDPEY
jgi:hypothetical protein